MKILSTEKFNSQETPTILLSLGKDTEVNEFMQYIPDDNLPLYTAMERFQPDALFVGLKHKISAEVMQRSPNLKVIATRTTGLDHIELAAAKGLGIEILSLRGEKEFLKDIPATAELTFLKMGELLRRDEHELKGKTLGIIGYGRIGKLLEKYALAFGMNVLKYDINFQDTKHTSNAGLLEVVLSNSDIVSLNITADEENRNFMDGTKFEKMKNGSYFLNSSRSWLVKLTSLELALQKGKLAGAWSDFNEALHPKMISTNHQGGKTIESLINTELFMASKLVKYLQK